MSLSCGSRSRSLKVAGHSVIQTSFKQALEKPKMQLHAHPLNKCALASAVPLVGLTLAPSWKECAMSSLPSVSLRRGPFSPTCGKPAENLAKLDTLRDGDMHVFCTP